MCIVVIGPLIPVEITGSQANPLEFSSSSSPLTDGGDDMVLDTGMTFILIICAAHGLSNMTFIIRAPVFYQDVWVCAANIWLLMPHFRGPIVKNNSTINKRYCHHDDYSTLRVLHLLDLTLDCCKSVIIHLLWLALW